ncbi:PREDICTED: regulator of telomere elongation helicase 1 isoform X2 [Nelumbo nucifera]|uniref:Regulator of telomere elongation helicase 1 homolog n=1 Tax=Nelumbo nucifera TaxID=4432 RepID=A0A1U7ZMK9_NELNU|nr:PREDICTED: regulator of telomere elongation helicase 1 isoform X2 [Nelumbo nucifera]
MSIFRSRRTIANWFIWRKSYSHCKMPKMVVLGSREQLCIHDDVQLLRGRAQTNACHSLCRKDSKRRCSYYARVGEFVKKNPSLGDDPIDIEDLVNIGRTQGPCPYYISRDLHKVVDILFAPYNYLIDRGNRETLTIEWKNSILIFDEAHNLESICADAASFDLPSGLLSACITEAKNSIDLAVSKRATEKSNDKLFKPDNFAILKALLLKLEKHIAEVPIDPKELGFTRPGPYIYEFLAELNITHETASMLIETIDQAAELINDDANMTESRAPYKTKGTICRLESISDILKIIFRNGDKAHAKYYQVHVQEIEANAIDTLKGKTSRMLSWWCFNPGIAMGEFRSLGVGSIILTSGTLSPLDSFAQELKLEFPVRLENPHVISSNQIWAGIVPNGPSGCAFNSSYRNRDSLDYKQELGNAIVNFARIVPDGLLVFFPSYHALDQCIACWKNVSHLNSNSSTIWGRICKHKQPVVEPKQSSLFASSIEDFMAKLKDTSTSGAIFFAVCRGKVSEGLDFADHAGRAVIITGIPFALRTDPKVRLKREYLDHQAQSQKRDFKVLTGEEWYCQQALRAVNQAVGRVIRHRHDYGAIIFCDERFAHQSRQCQMSLWLQPHIKCFSKFGDVVFTLTRFFRGGAKSSLAKLKLTETKNMGNAKEVKITRPQQSCLLASLTHLTTSVDEDCSEKPLSSVLEASRGNTCSQLGEILPANRSNLTHKHDSPSTIKHLKDPFYNQKRLRVSGKKSSNYQDCEVLDLTCNSPQDEQSSMAELIVPCSSKKPKIIEIDSDAMGHSVNFLSLENLHNAKIAISSYTYSTNNSETQTQLSTCGLAETGIGSSSSSRDMQNKGVIPTVRCDDEERKGSAFLIQVKEKLTVAEYKEFVGFMKSLKSKTMKMSNVLQSIVRLFSAPERHHLLKRFKDYIPEKYHPMYEQHLRHVQQLTVDATNHSVD